MGDTDTVHDLAAYRKKIDIIDMDRLESGLSVKNYLIFYAMVISVYGEDTLEKLEALFVRMEMGNLWDKPMNRLSKEEKIKVRCLAAHLKQIHCLVGKDLLEDLSSTQKERVIRFLNEIFGENHCFCVLFESGTEMDTWNSSSTVKRVVP